MKILHSDIKYKFLCSREFIAALNSTDSQLKETEQIRCREDAKNLVYNFREHGVSPELEALDKSDDSNLFVYHLEHAKDLSIVLAVEEEKSEYEERTEIKRGIVVLANVGKINEMRKWAKSQYYDFDPILARPLKYNETEETMLDIVQEKGFEAWKFFLHPEQKYFTRELWDGPVYITGAAGTGKTVIGLHYAATLSRRYPKDKILFTTKRSALLKRFKERFRLLRKSSENVIFAHIDEIAYSILREERVDWEELEEDDHALWKERQRRADDIFFNNSYACIIEGTSLENLGKDYIKEEVVSVIIGGGISSFEEYCCSQRWGRLYRIRDDEALRLIWSFYKAWEEQVQNLDRDGRITRYVDRLEPAREIIMRETQTRYRSVIVDEAQDMNLAEMKLVRSLVADASGSSLLPDSLLMLGDRAQQILPGGFCRDDLRRIGIDIEGRDHILFSNYRNSEAIYRAAVQVRGTDCVTGETTDLSSVWTELKDKHARPCFIMVKKGDDIKFIGNEIKYIIDNERVEKHHIGILIHEENETPEILNVRLESIRNFLQKEMNIDCSLVKNGIGNGVRLDSFRVMKGLEFRFVFIPYLSHSRFPKKILLPNDGSNINPRVEKEARLLELGSLYAAMTRARDQLYLIADEEPCEEILKARDSFEWLDQR